MSIECAGEGWRRCEIRVASSLWCILALAAAGRAQRFDIDPVEAFLVVTAVAIVAEFAVMNIVPPVTIDAAPAGLVELLERPVMATVAMLLGMGMPELEVRLIVVEGPDQPVIRIVA